jgi:hypothetical protein
MEVVVVGQEPVQRFLLKPKHHSQGFLVAMGSVVMAVLAMMGVLLAVAGMGKAYPYQVLL